MHYRGSFLSPARRWPAAFLHLAALRNNGGRCEVGFCSPFAWLIAHGGLYAVQPVVRKGAIILLMENQLIKAVVAV
jgi:hypothetical protein